MVQLLTKKVPSGCHISMFCLDELKSARNKREAYIGPDLPEPLMAETSSSPDKSLELAESLSMALLVVLNRLSPIQRAVFLLHEVFEYDYASISSIVDRSESNCRKIAQRARDIVREEKPLFEEDITRRNRLVQKFMEAVRDGDMPEIERLLAEDAVMYTDGGGKVAAALKPVQGAAKIAKFMVGVQKKTGAEYRATFKEINGEPGLILWMDNHFYGVWSFHIEGGRIKSLYSISNPDKLEHIKRTLR